MEYPSYAALFPEKKSLIAVIHLDALPGSPLYSGNMHQVFDRAIREAEIFERNGVDGLIIENFGDAPFYPDRVPAETIAAMAAVSREVVNIMNAPVGINVLRNDARAAMAIAAAVGADFIRVNVHISASVTDQGLIQGRAFETLRLRSTLKTPALVFCDVAVKHAAPLAKIGLDLETRDLTERGMADAVIVSGSGTGQSTSFDDLKAVGKASKAPVLIGSGITHENLGEYLPYADGFIVGSCLKVDGNARNEVEEERVRMFVERLKEER